MVSLELRIRERLCQLPAKYAKKHKHRFKLKRSIVTFTFDDYPRSALENGGAVLEGEGVRGTFYGSLGLASTEAPTGPIGSVEELVSCTQHGHELGCHTFAHLRCSTTPTELFMADIKRNATTCAAAASVMMRNFAYPFGSMKLSSKSAIMTIYDSARANVWGVNRHTIDLGFLLAVPIYSFLGKRVWQRFLDDIQRTPGWLIFYTHDVAMGPTRFGCTPADLLQVVKAAKSAGADILTINEALSGMTAPQKTMTV